MRPVSIRIIAACVAAHALHPQAARSANVLHSFAGNGDGAIPAAGLIADGHGTLYGAACIDTEINESGTIFSLARPAGGSGPRQFAVLYQFPADGSLGNQPCSTLWRRSDGALFGTTQSGGGGDAGTAFELDPPAAPGNPWTETILHNFSFGKTDGATPAGRLTADAQSRLFGTTLQGGLGCQGDDGCGVVYMLTPPSDGGAWTETILHFFKGRTGHAGFPAGDLLLLPGGILAGTIAEGVFTLTPPIHPNGKWQFQILPVSPALAPVVAGGVVQGNDGTLYGMTELGGANNTGTVYALHPPQSQGAPWVTETLHEFGPIIGTTDGMNPSATLAISPGGSLFATMPFGGVHGGGIVFRMDPPAVQGAAWSFSTLQSFGTGAARLGDTPADTPLLLGCDLYLSNTRGGTDQNGTIVRIPP